MKPEQFAINSVSTGGATLAERFTGYAAAGFTRVELCLPQVHEALEAGESVASVGRMLEDAGLACIGGFECPLACFAGADERDASHDRCAANAELLAALGAGTMVVGTDGPADSLEAGAVIDRTAETFAAFGERIADTGITVCLEFNWSPVIRSLRSAAAVVEAAGRENVRVLFDPAHYHCTPSKLEHLDAATVATIGHVHVDDMADKPGDLSHCNGDRRLPGEGCLPLAEIFDRIESHGYAGDFSIEMFDPGLREMPVEQAARRMYESLGRLL